MVEATLDSIAQQLETLLREQAALRTDLAAATGGGTLTLGFLAAQQERLPEEIGQIRDDLRVAAAMVQRLDGTMQGLVNEVRAEHGRYDRLDRRIGKLEPRFEPTR